MSTFKDFVGLNYGIYDPVANDAGTMNSDGIEGNYIGYNLNGSIGYIEGDDPNPNITGPTRHNPRSTMVLLNLHRNGPYGYPTWKQIRVSDNHLTRYQRKSNIFTYVEEYEGKDGDFKSFIEPVVVDSYKPVSLVGEVKVYNDKTNEFQNRSVELKTSFGNETAFFANSKINDYFETIAETDDNYEQMKDLYLDGGLEDEGSPIDSFNMFVYRQSIYPKQQYAYLDETRSRKYYVNTYWRSDRNDRRQDNVDNGFGVTVPEQSMWPLDARRDFETRQEPTADISVPTSTGILGVDLTYDFDLGGHAMDNSSGGPGVLQNRYSMFLRGVYYYNTELGPSIGEPRTGISNYLDLGNYLTSSAFYSRPHTLKNIFSSVNPSGPKLVESEFTESQDTASPLWPSMTTGSIFNGTAHWDAPKQSDKEPFYDSYKDFSQELRTKGKSFSKIPEFRISSHVEDYLTKGIVDELPAIFEISGALDQNTTTENNVFYEILSNSDFLQHFDLVKKDHKDLASEKILTLKCKALKKFLPYEGFYPAQRTEQIAKQFHDSYSQFVKSSVTSENPFYEITNDEQFSLQPLMTPIAAPGILFNTIKSGVAVDFPLIFAKDLVTDQGDNFNTFLLADDIERLYAAEVAENVFYDPKDLNNALIGHSLRSYPSERIYRSIYSSRIPFEALVEPENYLANQTLTTQEPHPFALSDANFECTWDGQGDPLFKKMSSNFLAEVPEFFIQNENFKTISSLEEQSPEFGNATAGNYYVMRIKMSKSRNRPNITLGGYGSFQVTPPQDVATFGVDEVGEDGSFQEHYNRTIRETMTMYSRPTAFGPPTSGDSAPSIQRGGGLKMWNGSSFGYNFPYTPPYYHGDAWCDLIFAPSETRKYTLDEILREVQKYPYYTRYWEPSVHDAIRDLSGYEGLGGNDSRNEYADYDQSPWASLIGSVAGQGRIIDKLENSIYAKQEWADMIGSQNVEGVDQTVFYWSDPGSGESGFKVNGPQSAMFVNYNAMQLDSSVNLFGKGTIKTKNTTVGGQDAKIEVASSDTVAGKTRWIIQPKFETPILNFNKYTDLNENNCTPPDFAKSQVPRGMWHQYGDLPTKNEGVYLQVEDIPKFWLRGALGIDRGDPRVKSLADLVGFKKDKVRLGEVANVKEISEAVVAVPFIEKDGTRQFFSIPREDIDSCINSSLLESSPGNFAAGQTPKAGDSVYQMVKKMQKYVFPPSMDFVKYKEIDPFAMYIFEFKHNLTKQDLADIWQNLPPEIGIRMEEAEATISHELLAHELLGGGSVVKNGVLDDNAEGNGIPSNIQWMIFKAKKRAKTNYFDKVVAKKGTTADTSSEQLENAQGQTGDDLGITYNWPYDFFSLVELVKIDAEVTFANIENDDKGQKSIKKVERKPVAEVAKSRMVAKGINLARGKGKFKK